MEFAHTIGACDERMNEWRRLRWAERRKTSWGLCCGVMGSVRRFCEKLEIHFRYAGHRARQGAEAGRARRLA